MNKYLGTFKCKREIDDDNWFHIRNVYREATTQDLADFLGITLEQANRIAEWIDIDELADDEEWFDFMTDKENETKHYKDVENEWSEHKPTLERR